MMNKRIILLFACTLVVAVVGFLLLVSPHYVSSWPRAYAGIELGMTQPEVEAAIGLPPGYYEGELPTVLSMSRCVKTPPLRDKGADYNDRFIEGRTLQCWIGREYVIWVVFDRQGIAVGTYLLEYLDRPPGLIERIRNRLGF
jgi:hypothetical protein